ncbi:MAG TPA: PilZ domain-containing protein [Pseudomonadales bacterium]|nr:PilZ domain-containing protein [Pseudomonadales bacterium]
MLTDKVVDKRKLDRHSLVYYIPLFDQRDGRMLAHMVDVNVRGFLASSDKPFLSGSLHRFRMQSEMDFELNDEIEFNAICLWCRQQGGGDEYDAGFKFINLSPMARQVIFNHA